MPVFQYRALQGDGAIAEGLIEAGGRQEAFRQMEGRGLKPISLAEDRNGKTQKVEPNGKTQTSEKAAGSPEAFKLSLGNANRISGRMLENFTRLLSSLLAAGVPLSRALVILSLYWKNGKLKSEIGVAQGKVAHDKRADLKKRATDRETAREVARFNRKHG